MKNFFNNEKEFTGTCSVCGKEFPLFDLRPDKETEMWLRDLKTKAPATFNKMYCPKCLKML